MSDIVVMGRIAAPYGVKGWLKVLPSTAEHEALLDYREWWLRKRDHGAWQKAELSQGRTHGNTLIVQVEGLDSREAAAAYAGGEVGVPRDALPAADADEMYVADLVGLTAVNVQGDPLGQVMEVQEFGAHPVLRLQDDAGATRLVPFVEAYVREVDVPGRRLVVDWQKDY